MVETPRRDRVGLGVIGLGPRWELIYRDALRRLQNRLTIRMVYDPVEARSKSIATELNAEAASSLHQIVSRPTLQGLLVLEPGWCSRGALDLATRCNRPVFLGCSVLSEAVEFVRRQSPPIDPCATGPFVMTFPSGTDINGTLNNGRPLNLDDQLMPELGLRFTPSSCRLRELMVTKLGPAHHIEIGHCSTSDSDEIAAIVDWCSEIVGSPLKAVAGNVSPLAVTDPIQLESIPHDSHRGTDPVTVRLWQRTDQPPPLQIELKCERGRARLLSRTHIQWQTAREYADESLTDERTETEILIDQFCRRALGGLNPVGRLSEFIRAHQIAQSIKSSIEGLDS